MGNITVFRGGRRAAVLVSTADLAFGREQVALAAPTALQLRSLPQGDVGLVRFVPLAAPVLLSGLWRKIAIHGLHVWIILAYGRIIRWLCSDPRTTQQHTHAASLAWSVLGQCAAFWFAELAWGDASRLRCYPRPPPFTE